MGLIISLIFIGLLLLLAELIIFPGVGLSGIAGIAALVGACVYAFMKISTTAGLITVSAIIVLVLIMIFFTLRSKTWANLTLRTKIESKAGQESDTVTIGEHGTTMTRIAPMGTARFGDRTMEVKSTEGIIAPDTKIKVVMIDDGKIYVASDDE